MKGFLKGSEGHNSASKYTVCLKIESLLLSFLPLMRCFTVHPIVIKWVRDVGVTGGGSGIGAKDNNCPILKPRVACFKFN